MNNKKKLCILTGIGMTLIIVLGVTYAWLTQVLYGTKVNRIKTGTLDLVLDDETSNGINLEYAVPQSDSQGLANTSYTFKVINNGTITAEYKLYLEDEEIEGKRLSDSNIKYSLVKNNEEDNPRLLSSSIVEEKRQIEDEIIAGGETNEYELKLWIDQESTKEEIANKVFKAKIKLEAVQTEYNFLDSNTYKNSQIMDRIIANSNYTNQILKNENAIAALDRSNPIVTDDVSRSFASSYYPGYAPTDAFREYNYWGVGPGLSYENQYIGYDFGENVWVYKMVIQWYSGKQNTDYVLEGSVDNTNYTIIKSGLHEDNELLTIIPDNYNQKYRYYRIRMLSSIAQYGSGNSVIPYMRFFAK